MLRVSLLVLNNVAELRAANAAQVAPEQLVGTSSPVVDHEVLREAQCLHFIAITVAEALLFDDLAQGLVT